MLTWMLIRKRSSKFLKKFRQFPGRSRAGLANFARGLKDPFIGFYKSSSEMVSSAAIRPSSVGTSQTSTRLSGR